jgi:phosphonate dehydrogenase
MRPKAVITHWVHSEVIALLQPQCEVVANDTRESWPRAELMRLAADADALMVFMPDSVDEAFLRACPRLKIVSAALKGYDNFDVEACTHRGVWFAIAKELLTAPAAELAVGLLIGIARHVLEGDRMVRAGAFKGWRPVLYGAGLAGRTAGIIGMGAIGRAVAKRLAAFEMTIVYFDPKPIPEGETDYGFSRAARLEELLGKSDFVLCAAPLTDDTRHLLDAEAIGRMKTGSYLVNIGRGSVLDEVAVAAALGDGHLAGYAADVFAFEDWARPDRPERIPAALLDCPGKTLFTPHLGSAVDEVRRNITLGAARNILQALNGERPAGAINDPPRQ